MLFTELSLCDTLQEGLQAMNFKETTPVQEKAIPVILEKKDVIACAQTGTGKTAAFLLPLLNNLQTDSHDEGKINAIVMAPTRELAQQIDQQMEGFSYFTPFSSVAVYGGNDGEIWDIQKRGLQSGADVVIATPGRLLSHINLYNIDFSGVKYFILDEADRMLDMGFHDDIMRIEKLLPKERQTIMFSATMPPKIQQLAKTILHNPVDITIAVSKPPETILQSAYICHEAQKINIVKHLFKEKAPNKVILFSGSKQKVKEIAKILRHMGLSADEMHSDLDQAQRNHVMHEFKNERVNILVATDIVARGIDIDDISLVINFDVPYDAEDYVHRIGRTARAGDSGMAITFVSPDEQYRFSKIEEFLGKKIYRIPVPSELGETPEYNPVRDNRRGGTSGRSSKGGKKGKDSGRKGGKPEGRTERSGNSGETGKSENARGSKRFDKSKKSNDLEGAPQSDRTEGVDRSGKTEEANKPVRQEGVNKTGKTGVEKSDKVEGIEKSGKTERIEKSGNRERNERPEKSKGPRKNDNSQQQEASHSERSPQEGQASQRQGEHKKHRKPKREGTPQPQGGQQGLTREREQRPPREQRDGERSHKPRQPRDSNSPANDTQRKRPSTNNPSYNKRVSTPQKASPAPEQATEAKKSKRWWWPFGKK